VTSLPHHTVEYEETSVLLNSRPRVIKKKKKYEGFVPPKF